MTTFTDKPPTKPTEMRRLYILYAVEPKHRPRYTMTGTNKLIQKYAYSISINICSITADRVLTQVIFWMLTDTWMDNGNVIILLITHLQ